MKKTEIILVVVAIMGLIMRFNHYPFSGLMVIVPLFLLAMLYFYLGFALFNNLGLIKALKKKSFEGKSKMRIIGAIATGLALSISIIGMLFKTMFWPGAIINLLLGVFSISVIVIISFVKLKITKDNYYLNILKRTIAFGLISLFLVLLPSKDWLSWNYPNNPDYIKAVLEAEKNPANPILWEKVEEERKKMYGEKG